MLDNAHINVIPDYHRYRLRVGMVGESIAKFPQHGGGLSSLRHLLKQKHVS